MRTTLRPPSAVAIPPKPAPPEHDAPPVPRRRPRFSRRRIAGAVLANAAVVLVVIWWWQAAEGTTNPSSAPPPGEVWDGMWSLVVGDLRNHTITSVARVLVAVTVAIVVGTLLVLISQVVPVTRALIEDRILPFLNSMPAFGWAIWGLAWFGATNFSVTFILVMILLPFGMVNMSEGMRALDPALQEMGRSFTRRRLAVFTRIEFPLLVPYLFGAARLAFGVGFKVALIAEFFGAEEGLGLILNRARQSFNPPLVWAAILVVVVIVVIVERAFFRPLSLLIARRSGTLVEDSGVAAGA